MLTAGGKAGLVEYSTRGVITGSAPLQGEGDAVARITAKLEAILEARKEQYSQADIHVGLGAPQKPLGASPALVTRRCDQGPDPTGFSQDPACSPCFQVLQLGTGSWGRRHGQK